MREPLLETILQSLRAYEPNQLIAEPGEKTAAVAMIVCGGEQPSLLMIKRAEHPKDPWSGHMAFPGGRIESSDATALSAAMREVREEIGLVLSPTDFITPLSPRYTLRRGHRNQVFVSPFVFFLNEQPSLSVNEEVAAVTHIPLRDLLNPSRYSSFAFSFESQSYQLPCYLHDLGKVWGLSLHFVDEFCQVVSS